MNPILGSELVADLNVLLLLLVDKNEYLKTWLSSAW